MFMDPWSECSHHEFQPIFYFSLSQFISTKTITLYNTFSDLNYKGILPDLDRLKIVKLDEFMCFQ